MKHTGFPPTAEVGGMENTQLAKYARSLLVEASKRTKEELVRDLDEAFAEIIRLRQRIAELERDKLEMSWKK